MVVSDSLKIRGSGGRVHKMGELREREAPPPPTQSDLLSRPSLKSSPYPLRTSAVPLRVSSSSDLCLCPPQTPALLMLGLNPRKSQPGPLPPPGLREIRTPPPQPCFPSLTSGNPVHHSLRFPASGDPPLPPPPPSSGDSLPVPSAPSSPRLCSSPSLRKGSPFPLPLLPSPFPPPSGLSCNLLSSL